MRAKGSNRVVLKVFPLQRSKACCPLPSPHVNSLYALEPYSVMLWTVPSDPCYGLPLKTAILLLDVAWNCHQWEQMIYKENIKCSVTFTFPISCVDSFVQIALENI